MEETIIAKRRPELSGKEWLQNSISIWSDIRKTAEESSLKHPAMFPKMLASRLIACFSIKGDTILDPFAGSGSTLFAAKDLKRKSIGIELAEESLLFLNFISINSKISLHETSSSLKS